MAEMVVTGDNDGARCLVSSNPFKMTEATFVDRVK